MPINALWWVKRDLRLADNPALTAAVDAARRGGGQVLPVFCHEPSLLAAADTSAMHAHAWCQGLTRLRGELRARGADVLVSNAEVLSTFADLRRKFPFTHVFAHEEVGNALTFARDQAVAAWCREQGVAYRELPQSSVRRGGIDRGRLQAQWVERVSGVRPLPTAAWVPLSRQMLAECAATAIPPIRGSHDWQPVSEGHAAKTLSQFLSDRGLGYAGGISSPNSALHCGSRLSAHLAWGTLSVRQVYHATVRRLVELDRDPMYPQRGRWALSLKNFLARLHWRDHFVQRLETEPAMEFRPLHPAYRKLQFEDDPALLQAWKEGRTGFPLVDAVMRCLAATGFVNFRMRALATSHAVHGMHLDWRTIHPHLAGVFRDYEPGIHLSQLQMQAGVVGLNTIRVYSPQKQLEDQDPRCRFVQAWVPELRDVPAERILAHHLDPVPGYVPPVVDMQARQRAMKDILFTIRAGQDPAETAEVYRRHASRRTPFPRPVRRRPAKRKVVPLVRPDQPSLF